MLSKRSTFLKKSPILNRFVLQLLFIMFFVEFVKGALLITILPVYMGTVLGLSAFIIGWSLSLQYIGDNLFRSPIGWVVDRIGYRWSMLLGVILTFVSVAIMATTTHFGWIIAASALLGAGTSPLWPCVITGATEVAGDRTPGTIMSVVYMAWLSGVGLGPIVINFFVQDTYGAAFRLLIIIMIAVVLVTLFLPGKLFNVQAKPASLRQTKTSDPMVPANAKAAAAMKVRSRLERIRQYFAEVKRSVSVSRLLFPAMFAQTFSLGLLTPVLTLYARTVLQLTPNQYSLLLLSGGIVTVGLLIPVGKLVDRWGTSWFLHIGFSLSAATLIVFTYFTSVSALFVLVGLLGIGYALIIPSWNALIASAIPHEKRGAIWGFFLTIEGLGMIVGPIVSGKLWDLLGPHAPFLTSGFVLVLLFVLHLSISLEKKVVVR